jgi:hypothetical protein
MVFILHMMLLHFSNLRGNLFETFITFQLSDGMYNADFIDFSILEYVFVTSLLGDEVRR